MLMTDHLAAIEAESARFSELIGATPLDAAVPSCPGWTVADLAWHLAEVQHFWGTIAGELLLDADDVVKPAKPPDTELPTFFDRQSLLLRNALAARHPDDACWSWHDGGNSVAWVARRQAHEALIHRIDAELAAGTMFRVDEALAADGVDEILRVMMDVDSLPEWAVYETDGATALIELDDRSASWALDVGRFKGTSPNSGTTYDFPAVSLIAPPPTPTAVVRGAAADLDLWLWGRGALDPTTVTGDRAVADHIRAAAADATQ